MVDGWNAAQRESEILQLRAERDAADAVAYTARAYVGAMEYRLTMAIEALRAVVRDINEYEHANNLAPNPGRAECWDSVAHAKAVLDAVGGSGDRGSSDLAKSTTD